MMLKKLVSILVTIIIILSPLSSIPVLAEDSCTLQEQINYICSLGPDSALSCSSEWPQYGNELNELIVLREAYGGGKQLSETDYRGSCLKADSTTENKPGCTIQERINWICAQSEKDSASDCTAEYENAEYAAELNKLVELRNNYGQTKLLSEIGYSKDECEAQKPEQKVTEKTENGKTTIASEGVEIEIKNGIIIECKKDGVKASCPENAKITETLSKKGTEEIVPNRAKINMFSIGNGKTEQLYTPYSLPNIELLALGEKGSELAVIVWLTDENGARLVPIKFLEGSFGSSEGDFVARETFSVLVDDGKYNAVAELWQDGLKRDERFFLSEGTKGALYILEKPEEALTDISMPTDDEVAGKLHAYLDARYKHPQNSNEYRKAFKEFMEAYIKSSFESEQERKDALAAFNSQDVDSLIKETETAFRKQIQQYYIDSSITAMNVAYDEVKGIYSSQPQLSDWLDILNPGKYYIVSGINLLQQFHFNRNYATFTKNPEQIDELRSSLLIAKKYVDSGGDYNELYSRMMKNEASGKDEKLLSKTMKDYRFKGLFEAIKNTDSAGVHYYTGKIFTHFAIFAFIDLDYLLDNAVDPVTKQKMTREKAIEAIEQEEEALYMVGADLTPQMSGIPEKLRNLVQLGQDQFDIAARLYPGSPYEQKMENTNRNVKAWGGKLGFVGGMITFTGLVTDAGLIMIGGIGMASAVSKIPAVASRISTVTKATKLIMFSGAAIAGAQTIGGCIDYFAEPGKVSQAGTEWEKCYAPAAATVVLTVAPAKLSPKSLKPLIKSDEGKALFAKTTAYAKPAILPKPARIPNIKETPANKVTPEAAADKVAEQTAKTAESISKNPAVSSEKKESVLNRLTVWVNSKKVKPKAEKKAKQAEERIEQSRENIKKKTPGKKAVNSNSVSYRVGSYDFKGKIIRYGQDIEVYALSDPHGDIFKVMKGLEDAKLISPKTRQSMISKYTGDKSFRITDAEIELITNEVSENLKNKAFVILGDVIDVETSGAIDYGDDIIKLVTALERKTDYRVTSLMGNHEAARFGHLPLGKGELIYDTTDIDANALRRDFITNRPIAAVQENKVFIHSAISEVSAEALGGSRAFGGQEFYNSFSGRRYMAAASDEVYSALGVNKDAIFIEGHTSGHSIGISGYGWKGSEFIISPEYPDAISTVNLRK